MPHPDLLYPLLPAALLEAACCVVIAAVRTREYLGALPPLAIAFVLWVMSMLPWCFYAQGSHGLLLAALTAPVAFWYVLLPRSRATDFVLLAGLAAVILAKSRLFRLIYPDPAAGFRIDILGQLMWIRLGVGVMLLLRKAEGIHFGFWPTREEWRIGFRCYLQAMPLGILTGFGLGMLRVGTPIEQWWQAPFAALAVFLGIFCVVAMSEEFLLRGLLLGWLRTAFGTRGAHIVATVVSGLVHLGFRSSFNWKFCILSAVVHWFFGKAYLEGNGIRAGMVAHALVVTTWVMVFAKSG
ncbi:MAG: CPBP family glutamic-type intramembrane protease [Bryobacteraceae bacterium]